MWTDGCNWTMTVESHSGCTHETHRTQENQALPDTLDDFDSPLIRYAAQLANVRELTENNVALLPGRQGALL